MTDLDFPQALVAAALILGGSIAFAALAIYCTAVVLDWWRAHCPRKPLPWPPETPLIVNGRWAGPVRDAERKTAETEGEWT